MDELTRSLRFLYGDFELAVQDYSYYVNSSTPLFRLTHTLRAGKVPFLDTDRQSFSHQIALVFPNQEILQWNP